MRRYGATRKKRPSMDDLVLERSLQENIRDAASLMKWPCYYHAYDSRRSPEGFPDVVIVGYGKLIMWELKRQGKDPTDSQQEWLDELSKVEGPPTVEVVRPQDLDRCLALLQAKGRP